MKKMKFYVVDNSIKFYIYNSKVIMGNYSVHQGNPQMIVTNQENKPSDSSLQHVDLVGW